LGFSWERRKEDHVFRRILTMLCLLALTTVMAGFTSCWRPDKGSGQEEDQQVVQSGKYKVRLVFEGLVSFWVPDNSESPGEVLLLVPNAKNPGQFTVGQRIPEHHASILVSEGVRTSGRPLVAVTQPHGIEGNWQQTDLSEEELIINANVSTPLRVVRNQGRFPEPCQPPGCEPQRSELEKRDLLWVADINNVLSKIRRGSANDKRIKECLTAPTFNCPQPLLAARMRLKNGDFFVSDHHFSDSRRSRFTRFDFKGQSSNEGRALARAVAAELEVEGPFEIQSRALGRSREATEPLVIHGEPGQELVVRIGSHPMMGADDVIDNELDPNHFRFVFNFLNNPEFIPQDDLPFPVDHNDGQNFDGQCSPNGFTGR
jgi:hypothetical protein